MAFVVHSFSFRSLQKEQEIIELSQLYQKLSEEEQNKLKEQAKETYFNNGLPREALIAEPMLLAQAYQLLKQQNIHNKIDLNQVFHPI